LDRQPTRPVYEPKAENVALEPIRDFTLADATLAASVVAVASMAAA